MSMTPQDHHDLADDLPSPAPAAPPPLPTAPALEIIPPGGWWTLIQSRPYVAPWCGPYARIGEPLAGRWLVAVVLETANEGFAYEIRFPAGADGELLRREHRFHCPRTARHCAGWELERLEKLFG